ncbi:MAG TPA: hypothetical protein V6D07_01665 [Trichocoleus sp.]
MLLSTFELLLKKITPTPGTVSGSDRGILQGYFLTVANPNNVSLRLRLRFNAQTPGIDRSKLLVIKDTGGSNEFTNLSVSNTYDFRLDAGDTGLIIVQPDITKLKPGTDEVEVRGYVEISAVSSFFFPGNARTFPLLVTPEHRGTFLGSPGGSSEFDQLVNALPTSSGSCLLNVETVLDRPVVFPQPPFPISEIPTPELIPVPLPDPVGPVAGVASLPNAQLENIQQVLNFMAQRIDELSQQVPSAAQREVPNGGRPAPVAS